MNGVIHSAASLWMVVNRARRALYRRGVLRGRRLSRPVISIGNITAGGAGKTPAVIALCRHLTANGLHVTVLTRGYGRGDAGYSGPVTSLDAARFGDEPVLIKKSVNVDVIVGKNRYENARDHSCDVFVLDDGFQHLQLHRDFDIVIDAPGRFHREGRTALSDADAVVPRTLRTVLPEGLRGRPVFAFSALADNEQFFDSLRAEGLELAGTRGFRDHHRYTDVDLASLREEARGATLVTTGKDAVKIAQDIVAVGAEFVFPSDVLDRALTVARGGVLHEAAPETPAEAPRKKRRKNRIVQRLEYVTYRAINKAVASRSEESLHRWGTRLGALAQRVLRGRNELAMRNLRLAFPERDEASLRAIRSECWRHFGREVLLYLRLQNLSLEEVAALCPTVNENHLHEAIARGKGTVLISAHWGGWEVAGLALMSLVQNVRTVARPLDNELLERDVQKIRARTGAEVVDRRKAARVLLRGLSENAVLVLLPDQAVQPREGILAPFMGHPAWTTPAPAKLALRAGASIVFGFCIPEGFRHRLEFEEPITGDELAAGGEDALTLTTRINEVISRRIRERPELWLWMHDRWKWTGERDAANEM